MEDELSLACLREKLIESEAKYAEAIVSFDKFWTT